MQITTNDVKWNYIATFLKIGATALLLPFILKLMSSETVGIWTIFITITSFVWLLDFGFSPSFTRNITYVFCGVHSLKIKGFHTVDIENSKIDYSLLKGIIIAMRWFYFRVAIALFLLLITLGTYYIHTILLNYKGIHSDVYIAWILLCMINTYNLSTLYYDCLLQGKGLIKRSKQIIVIGQIVYLLMAAVLILFGFGLIAIVSAQAISVIIVRWLSYRSFFTKEIRQILKEADTYPQKDILLAIYPNSIKIGLTTLGGLMVQKSSIFIGSLYLTLEEIASYGITIQFITIISIMAGIYTTTYLPQIAEYRIHHNNNAIKKIYIKGQIFLISTYLICGASLLGFGEIILDLLGSQTQLIPLTMLAIAIIISLLETNHSIAGSILLSKNEVPYFKASLVAGCITVLLLIFFFHYYINLRLWALILAPGIAQALYQNWRWPIVVINELQISFKRNS